MDNPQMNVKERVLMVSYDRCPEHMWTNHGPHTRVRCPMCVRDLEQWQKEQVKEQVVKALDVQVGGKHYKNMAIQPIEYIFANGLGFCEGNILKYLSRWRDKGGVEDLRKARHYLDLLIEHETKDTP